MAEVKISALTAATGLTDDDVLVVNDGATTKKITVANAFAGTIGGAAPSDGAVGDSPSSFDNTDSTKFRPWNVISGAEISSIAVVGRLAYSTTYLREVTDVDSIAYRISGAKTSGTAYFVIYATTSDGFATGAPLWSHVLSDATSAGAVIESGLTPFSLAAGWYAVGIWNPNDAGGNLTIKGSIPVIYGPVLDVSNPDYPGLSYNHGANTAPATLAGTETTTSSATSGPPAIGVLDSTS